MSITISSSHADAVVLRLMEERRIDPYLGQPKEARHKIFGLVHPEGDGDLMLFLRWVGFEKESDNGLAVYRIQSDDVRLAAEEATKIFISIKDGLDYHGRLSVTPLRPTSSWHPQLSAYEWNLLEERGFVAGLACSHWYEVFLAFNDTDSLERLAKFYQPPSDQTERVVEVVTDSRVLDYFAANPERLLSSTPRQFEQLIAELLEKLGYKSIELCAPGRDGGVDITAYIEHAVAVERVVVQCKRYTPPHKVGEPTIKQLLTDVDLRRAARGLIVTTTSLSRPARLLVESFRHRLTHLEGDELRERLIQFREADA